MQPATANIKVALEILAINTPVPVPATPAAQAALVAASIPNALVPHLILGAVALALAPQLINTPVPAPAIPVVPAPLAAASTPNALVPAAMSGKMVVVNNKF